MLDVLERVEQGKMSVELVKEHFDPTIAPIKAWAARMELKARSERTAMGRAARYANNKIHPGSAPYGYRVVDNVAEPHPVEAPWVKSIFDWYLAGVSYNEIRRRLIAGGAPQRQGTSYGKGKVQIAWQKGILQKILRNEVYATGRMSVKMSTGQRFTLTLPPLISPLTWERTLQRREKNKSHPLHHVKYNYLISGLAYCQACGVKLSAKTRHTHGYGYSFYFCSYYDLGVTGHAGSGCCRAISGRKLDQQVWEKAWRVLSDDAFFESRVREKIEALRKAEQSAEAEIARLERGLDDITMHRQKIINWALADKITEDDMQLQLAAIGTEETVLKRELSDKSLLVGDRAQRLIDFANLYREKLRAGADFLNSTLETPEAAAEQFALRREVVESIVDRIEVDANKQAHVTFIFDFNEIGNLIDQDNSSLREFLGNSSLKDFKLWEAK